MDWSLVVLVAVIAFYAVRYVVRKNQFQAKAKEHHERGLKVKQDRDDKKYDFGEENKDVLKCKTIEELLEGQFSLKFTAKDIVNTFANRCYTIGRDLNLTCDEMFTEAMELADECDKKLSECLKADKDPHQSLGKLHGIPFSIKDHIQAKGTLCTNGLSSRCDRRSDEDAVIVKVFKKLGGIPLVKGNTPQACLSYHSTNSVWGTAKNPWNHDRTCGGSSGGEAGLLAANCVPFGIGSDLLGSLRVPAVFCGINGYLPTPHRVSPYGSEAATEGGIFAGEVIRGALGPMTRNVDDLIYLYRLYLSEDLFCEDLRLPKLEFDQGMFKQASTKKNLRIGVLRNTEESFGLSPAVKRSLDMVEEILEKDGHDVIDVEIPDLNNQINNAEDIVMHSMLEYFFRQSAQESCSYGEAIDQLFTLYGMPQIVLKAFKKILELKGDVRQAALFSAISQPSIAEFMDKVKMRFSHMNAVERMWKTYELDVMVIPCHPLPAFPAKLANDVGFMPAGTRLPIYWNYCSGTLPITTVQKDEQKFEEKLYNDSLTRTSQECMKDSEGLPVGVEICGLPYTDEKVLAIMKIIAEKVKFEGLNKY